MNAVSLAVAAIRAARRPLVVSGRVLLAGPTRNIRALKPLSGSSWSSQPSVVKPS